MNTTTQETLGQSDFSNLASMSEIELRQEINRRTEVAVTATRASMAELNSIALFEAAVDAGTLEIRAKVVRQTKVAMRALERRALNGTGEVR